MPYRRYTLMTVCITRLSKSYRQIYKYLGRNVISSDTVLHLYAMYLYATFVFVCNDFHCTIQRRKKSPL